MGLVSQAVHDGGWHVIGYYSPSLFLTLFGKVFSFSVFSQRFWVEWDIVFVLVSFSIDSICHVIVSCKVIPKTHALTISLFRNH